MTSPLANVQLDLVNSVEKAMEFKRWLGERRETPLGMDTESSGLRPERDRLRMWQFGDLHHGWAIPWDQWGGVALEAANEYEGDLVLHNSSFDFRFTQMRAGWKPNWAKVHDTLTIAHLANPQRAKGLKPLAASLVDPTAIVGQKLLEKAMAENKWTWGTVPIDFTLYWMYSALDPVLTCHIYKALPQEVVKSPAYDLEMAVVRICAQMMLKGLKLDQPFARKKNEELHQWTLDARQRLKDEWGIDNATSNAQVIKCLIADGVELTKRTASGKTFALDKEVLETIQHPVAVTISNIRKAEKICSSYLENMLSMVGADGRIHCNINTNGAKTGRMSITDPAFQTLHRDVSAVRNCIIPEDNYTLVSCDYDQIEMRMAAIFSQDQGLIDAFLSPNDFFCEVASGIWQEPIQKGDLRRQLTKNTCYGFIYGAGTAKMAETAHVSYDTMAPVVSGLNSTYPGLHRFSETVQAVAQRRLKEEGEAYVRTPYGRRIPLQDDRLYALVNFLIQGSAAEILKKSIVDLDAAGLGPYMLLPVHDEILFEIPHDLVQDAVKTIEETMTEREKYVVPLTCSANVFAERWGPK